MASSGDKNFNADCFCGRYEAQMSVGKNLDEISAAAPPLNSQPSRRQDEGFEGESLVARKLGRKGLLNIDLNVPPPEAPDGELTAEDGGGNGPETLPPPSPDAAPDDSARKAGVSVGGELDFNVEMRTAEIGEKMDGNKGRNRRWIALLGVAENALREKKEEEIRKRSRGASQGAELGGEAAATRKKIGGQRRRSLVEEWNREVAAEMVVVRSTRGRTVAMPSKYRDSVLGAAAAEELPRQTKNGKSATVFHTKRKSR